MNKRQRKKRAKKLKEKLEHKVAEDLRNGLKSFIGQPVSQAALQKMGAMLSQYMRNMLARPSIASMLFDIWDPEPPFGFSRDAAGVVHRAGMRPPTNGFTYRVRFCDHDVALGTFELSDTIVTCLRCIAAQRGDSL